MTPDAPPRILVVDDDEDQADTIAAFLRSAGMTVVVAGSGHAALREATSGWVDAAVVDVVMPDVDGWRTCGRLRDLFASRDVPVLMMTSLPPGDALPRSFAEGATGHLSKPVRRSVLLSTLRQLLHR